MARVVDTRLYDLLGVRPTASDGELKKAYKKLSRDQKSSGEKWEEIERAYRILIDPKKRQIYNERGLEDEDEDEDDDDDDDDAADFFSGAGMQGHPFESLFGGSMFGGGGYGRGKARGRTVHHAMRVSLKDLYNGKTKQIQLTKNIICNTCKGIGGKPGSVKRCGTCRGQGVILITQRIGPGMVQQMQSHCSDCGGQGETIDSKLKCKKCDGKKVVQDVKVLDVHIKKGMRSGQKITFSGEGDQLPGIEPGDIVIVIDQKDDDQFKRIDDDLYMTHKIGLTEALCGFKMTVQHLDGRVLLLKCNPGEVIQPDSVRTVLEEGMPKTRKSSEKGNLYVKFEIEFPEDNWIDQDQIKMLQDLLPSPDNDGESMESDDIEDVDMRAIEGTRGDTDEASVGQAYDDDTDHHGARGQSMGCAQQ